MCVFLSLCRYLKHVVLRFICSREDEALQLVRAISVLLELSPQEEKHIKEYLGYKVQRSVHCVESRPLVSVG